MVVVRYSILFPYWSPAEVKSKEHEQDASLEKEKKKAIRHQGIMNVEIVIKR